MISDPSIRVMSYFSEGRSHFTSPPACPLSSPVSLDSLDSLPSLRYDAHPLSSHISRIPNLAPESSILIPSSVVALPLSSSLDDDDTG